MSFIVRQISKTADGREIVRAATHGADSISIGRDSENAIHLPDLAVDMYHAKMSQGPGNRVTIVALGGPGFDLDGRSVKRAEIDPAVGGELRFGSHRLVISKDEAAPVISVSRVGALSESANDGDDGQRFTLKGLLPGRRIAAWSLIAAVLALFLVWPIWTWSSWQGAKERPAGFHADTMWSSGPLSEAHHSLEKNCQACHVNKGEPVTDKACLTCHKNDAHDHAPTARLSNARAQPGMWGALQQRIKTWAGQPEGQCVTCHTEHEGAGKMPRTAQAFCTDCHGSLKQRLADTRLPNASDFGTDHPQFMASLTANPGGFPRTTHRVSLAGPVSEDNGLKFPHDIHLSSTNGIARMVRTMAAEQGWGSAMQCKDCHTPTADGVRFQPVTMERNCQMCHSLAFDQIGGTMRTLRHGDPAQVVADIRALYRSTLPPRPLGLGGMRRVPGEYAAAQAVSDYRLGVRMWPGSAESAVNAVFSKGGACYDCHVVTRPGGGFGIMKVTQPTRYFEHGWFDHNAHKTDTCQTCHKAEKSRDATDVLMPDLAVCRTCHVGETGGKLMPVKTPVKSGCAMCHDYHIGPSAPWKPDADRRKTAERPDAIVRK